MSNKEPFSLEKWRELLSSYDAIKKQTDQVLDLSLLNLRDCREEAFKEYVFTHRKTILSLMEEAEENKNPVYAKFWQKASEKWETWAETLGFDKNLGHDLIRTKISELMKILDNLEPALTEALEIENEFKRSSK